MKILFLTRLFYPHIGGVEKHVMEVSKRFIRSGHKVIVITEKIIETQDEEIIEGINIRRISVIKDDWFKKFRIWKNIWHFRNLIASADVVHAHDVFFWYLPFRFLYPSKKIFTTFHGYEGNRAPGFKARFMHKTAELLSSGNICVGDFLKKWYGTIPDYVTYGAVEVPDTKSQISNKYPSLAKRSGAGKIQNTKYKILFLGRLEEEAGIMEYLKALKVLKEKKYVFEIIVLGEGSLRKKAKEFCIKHGVKVNFKNFVKDVNKYLSNCDFVFVSRYLGILEALSFKKFVFANFNNAIKKDYLEMASFAKYISISKDYKELSGQVEYFLKNDQNRNEMIDEGFNWVKSQTWGKMTKVYLRLWDKD